MLGVNTYSVEEGPSPLGKEINMIDRPALLFACKLKLLSGKEHVLTGFEKLRDNKLNSYILGRYILDVK